MPHLVEARHCPHCAATLDRRVPPGDDRQRLVCPSCGFVLYLGPQVAAGTITTLDGRLVLICRGVGPRRDFWSFPCGYVEMDETVQAAAVRETREECGLEVELETMLGAYSYPAAPMTPTGLVVVAFAARVTGGELRAGDDASAVQTVSPDAIPWDDLAFDSSRTGLTDWLERAKR